MVCPVRHASADHKNNTATDRRNHENTSISGTLEYIIIVRDDRIQEGMRYKTPRISEERPKALNSDY